MFPAEEIPDTIGTYRIVRRLAPNGPAEVYLARNEGPLGFARECELKLLPDTSDGSTQFAEELAREAAICAKMNHPAVVRVFDFFEHKGKLVLALEHVEGTSLGELSTWLADHRQKLGDAAVYYIGARLAGAIADAHAAVDEQGKPTPIVHRNLTPDNILLALDGEVRLTGFGVGKIVGRTPDTAIGKIKGTPGFMAPEQARGEPVTTKADVYGLGLLMWSLLAGKRPPTDGTWPRRISGLRTDLPREVAAVVDAALDHFPGTRKISAREIEQWLSKATSASKGKAELKERVAALRSEAHAKDDAPPPSRQVPPPSGANPFQGVRFGPPPEGNTAPRAARRAPEPPRPAEAKDTRSSDPQRMSTGTALSRVVLALPPPPPIDTPPAPTFGPPPEAVHAPRFGPPPTETTPAPQHVLPAPPATPSDLQAEAEMQAALEPAQDTPPAGTAMPVPSLAPPAPKKHLAKVPRPSIIGMQAPTTLDPSLALEPSQRAIELPSIASASSPVVEKAARKPLSAVGSIAVSAITAALVAAAVLIFVRRDHTTPKPAASAIATEPAPVRTATAAPPTTPTAPPPDVNAVDASASAASANTAELPYGFGYLTVVTPASANVYLSGKIAGPANAPLKVRCGRWFVRLAAPPESRYPEWVSPGETVVVACQQLTRVDMSAPK